MMLMLAFAAQVEATSIKERVLGAQAAIRTMPLRWRGSRPPYGYLPEPLEGGGWTLVPDPDAVKVIERMIRLLQGGQSAAAVARALNEANEPSPRDYWALKKGRETGGKTGGPKGSKGTTRERFKWSAQIVKKLLTSVALIGWKMHSGKPVRDSEGRPVMATNTPILTREEFDAIGALFAERANANGERHDTDAVLMGVIHCAGCEGRMYLSKLGARPATYKCGCRSRNETCDSPSAIKREWADEYVEREFLVMVGGLQVQEVHVIPGYDPSPEIDATSAEFEEHQKQEGRQKSKAAREAWQRRADALDARLAELEATPKVEPRRVVTTTGRTYADVWGSADEAGKRRMLMDAGARLTVKRGKPGGWRKLDESRVDFTLTKDLYANAADALQSTYLDAA
ncbi:recombinase family protein [Streptomyces sioyaensis]|uniref:recombinase family protein n=1 Tax=Streptomyces sioyaensis TaxID=67364 RepID=UPI0037D75443